MNLERELTTFHGWLKEYALPGFAEKAKDTYTAEYGIAYDELSSLGQQMRIAVDKNKLEDFNLARRAYLDLFTYVNEQMAKTEYADAVDHYLDQQMSNDDARKKALDFMWRDSKLQYWLPVHAEIKGPQGQEVFLVANERHTPRGKAYLKISEITYLKNSGLDPWEYVSNRRACEKTYEIRGYDDDLVKHLDGICAS
jgi:hypothetical protein